MTTFAGYEILGRVASGSTGTVWKARDPQLARPVAIKELHPFLASSAEARARLQEEARVLATLDEQHVVTVYDFVEEPDRAWIVEEWVDGASLEHVLAEHGPLSGPQACGVLRGALLGLAHAHERGLVHGDVKPGNILVDAGGTAKLVDFGLASPAGDKGGSGTPAYVSPEAVTGGTVDARSDVYSAAAVLFHLLSGHPPYRGSGAALLEQHVSAPVPRPKGPRDHLSDVVVRALSKDPDDRPADAGALLRELEEASRKRYGAGWLEGAGIASLVVAVGSAALPSGAAGAPVATSGALDTDRLSPRPRLRRRTTIGAAAAAVVAVAVGVAVATSGGSPKQQAAVVGDPAKEAALRAAGRTTGGTSGGTTASRPAAGSWLATTTVTKVGQALPGSFTTPPPPVGDISTVQVECTATECTTGAHTGQYGFIGFRTGPAGFVPVSIAATYTPCTAHSGPSYTDEVRTTLTKVSDVQYRGTIRMPGFRHAPCTSSGPPEETYVFGAPDLEFSLVISKQ